MIKKILLRPIKNWTYQSCNIDIEELVLVSYSDDSITVEIMCACGLPATLQWNLNPHVFTDSILKLLKRQLYGCICLSCNFFNFMIFMRCSFLLCSPIYPKTHLPFLRWHFFHFIFAVCCHPHLITYLCGEVKPIKPPILTHCSIVPGAIA